MSDNEKDFDDEEDEEDFEDDDFEDDVEEETPKKKKRKKEVSAASYFLDNEADVDEEAEEEDEEYEKDTGEIDWDAAQAEANAAQQNRQFHRRHLYDQDKSVEELAREIEERHKNYVLEDEDLEDDEDAPTELKRTGMLPSVRDPKLWMVHCKIGKERPTVIALMRKFFDPESKLAIKSAIAPGHLKGFIYIEAEKESHVKHAIKGMRTLSEWTLKLVPIKEMPDVLTVTKKANAFHKGDWVRVKRGLYKLDIGQVYDVDESRGRVTVKLIPRLDLQNMSKPEEGKKVKRLRMPARFFNPDEVNQVLGSRSDMDRRVDPYTGEHFYVLMGNRFLNGYLLKPMDVRSLEGGEVQPTLEELKKFQEKPPETGEESTTTSTEDLASLASTLKQQRRVAFKKGDTIIVVEGDLKHLMGTVESVDRETVTIRPKHEELHDLLTFPADQLRKYFKKGDHVKVITGRFDGETGLIIRVEENSVIIFSDLTNQEIKVFTQDIQECSEVSTGKIKLGNYELHDLVVYGATVGIITKIERDQFKLLDTTGTLQTVALSAMGPKKNSPRNANTFDSSQNVINVGDIVKVVDGQHKGRQGTIKHIFRYFLFLHSREMLENSGIFVVRTSHVTALGSKARPGDLVGALPGTQHFPPSSPGPRNLRSPARNAPSLPNTFDRKRSFKDTLKDKHVVILRGQWKGYVGIVRDSTETNARVELHTNSKIVTVPRDSVRLKDEAASEGSTMQEPSLYPPQTPAWGSRTPMREDPTATPLRTPSRTPSTPLRGVPGTPVHGTAWDASIPNTPMRTGSSWEPDYSANWTPSTPGAYSSQFTPYSPARQYDNTPADNPTTPSALTPGTYDQRTPMDSTPYSSSYQPNTPGTPGPVTPRGPNTPASEYGEQATPSSPGRYQWYIPKAEVTVNGELGVIQDVVIEKGMFVCKVLMDNTKQTVSVLADQAVKVVPGKGAPVIIVMGEQKGQTGTLIGIDNEDGIVKMDSNLDIKILDREHLAKYRK